MERYCIVTDRACALGLEAITAMVSIGMHRSDAIRIAFRHRGVLLRGLDEEVAVRVAGALIPAGIAATAIPESEYFPDHRMHRLSRMHVEAGDIVLADRAALGLASRIPLAAIECVVAGLTGTAELTHAGQPSMTPEGTIPFPLRRYLDADVAQQVNYDRRAPAASRMSANTVVARMHRFVPPAAVPRFISEHPVLEGWLCFSASGKHYSLEGHLAHFLAAQGGGGHWLRGFQAVVSELVQSAPQARISEGARVLAQGEDAQLYVYHDIESLREHFVWLSNRPAVSS